VPWCRATQTSPASQADASRRARCSLDRARSSVITFTAAASFERLRREAPPPWRRSQTMHFTIWMLRMLQGPDTQVQRSTVAAERELLKLPARSQSLGRPVRCAARARINAAVPRSEPGYDAKFARQRLASDVAVSPQPIDVMLAVSHIHLQGEPWGRLRTRRSSFPALMKLKRAPRSHGAKVTAFRRRIEPTQRMFLPKRRFEPHGLARRLHRGVRTAASELSRPRALDHQLPACAQTGDLGRAE
jgi:hypothetical protein